MLYMVLEMPHLHLCGQSWSTVNLIQMNNLWKRWQKLHFHQIKPFVISSGLTAVVVIQNEKAFDLVVLSLEICSRAKQLKCEFPIIGVWGFRVQGSIIEYWVLSDPPPSLASHPGPLTLKSNLERYMLGFQGSGVNYWVLSIEWPTPLSDISTRTLDP